MITAHLVTGNVGAGKTTYSIALAERLGAVRFSIDEWMTALFWMDEPTKSNLPWALERIERCEDQVWKVIAQLAARGVDVVLDLGLSRRDHRDRQRVRARALGIATTLHFLDVDRATRTARVEKRNEEKKESFAFEVTEGMIEFMEGYFEVPEGDELEGAVVVRPR
jgi:predicted kinase